jgi:hypothetical protein
MVRIAGYLSTGQQWTLPEAADPKRKCPGIRTTTYYPSDLHPAREAPSIAGPLHEELRVPPIHSTLGRPKQGQALPFGVDEVLLGRFGWQEWE